MFVTLLTDWLTDLVFIDKYVWLIGNQHQETQKTKEEGGKEGEAKEREKERKERGWRQKKI